MPDPGSNPGIRNAQRERVVVDAIVQAGLAARMAYSLTGGLAGDLADRTGADHKDLLEKAQKRADRAKHADMSLDHPIAGDPDADALREAASALETAAEAYRTAVEMREAADRAETAD